ncbi:MAG: signal peptidase I, partial [Calditrichaeota bacterium]|nr:signal peptidase I [Calditrichota bacterium]
MTSLSKTLDQVSDEKRDSAKKKPRTKSWMREWAEFLVTLFIMVFFIRVTTVEAFRIPTGSMEDTLLVG